ncbi:hypothetical protein SRABI128_01598 [Microbacterium sp. Bi128]|nr:hypothetical protein SRABI128_01598 [Microbacterium sp. Bi128]
MLLELAALRRGVEGLVLVAPDRHGGEPGAWWRIAEEFAERGYAVLVIAGEASRTTLDTSDQTTRRGPAPVTTDGTRQEDVR